MPKLDAADRRDARREKARRGMQVSGRSTKTVLLRVIARRTADARARIARGDEVAPLDSGGTLMSGNPAEAKEETR